MVGDSLEPISTRVRSQGPGLTPVESGRGSVSLKNWVCADGLGSDAAYPKLAFVVRMRFRSRDLGFTRAIGGPSHFLGRANQRMCGCKVMSRPSAQRSGTRPSQSSQKGVLVWPVTSLSRQRSDNLVNIMVVFGVTLQPQGLVYAELGLLSSVCLASAIAQCRKGSNSTGVSLAEQDGDMPGEQRLDNRPGS